MLGLHWQVYMARWTTSY